MCHFTLNFFLPNMTGPTWFMWLSMSKRHSEHCIVKCVKITSIKTENHWTLEEKKRRKCIWFPGKDIKISDVLKRTKTFYLGKSWAAIIFFVTFWVLSQFVFHHYWCFFLYHNLGFITSRVSSHTFKFEFNEGLFLDVNLKTRFFEGRNRKSPQK